MSGKQYRSNSELSVDDILQIAAVAKNFHRLNGYVSWLEAALEVAKREKKSKEYLSKLKKMIAQAKKEHDEVRKLCRTFF